jgi:phenylacetate-CoA ligase
MFDPEQETLDRESLADRQLARFRALLAEVLASNRFYQQRFAGVEAVRSWDEFRALPFTTKDELARDQVDSPLFGTNLTYPIERYTRLHQTSGTTGKAPIRWLDTPESWDWWTRCWGYVYRAAGVGQGDRIFFPFSFGPFIGFWAAYDGARSVGAMTVPGGGMQSEQRLQAIVESKSTVICCTPTYALRLAETAERVGIDLRSSDVRVTVHAGEPGASVPRVRDRIEEAWGAQCFDHTGMTEMGATGFSCSARDGVHLIESEFIGEVLDSVTGRPVPAGTSGELVLTNLGRAGMPLIRYRTGDLAELDTNPCSCGRTFARLRGGIIGRSDDMVVVRGMNVYPSAIENVVREFPEIAEFRVEISEVRQMAEARVLIETLPEYPSEAAPGLARRVGDALQRCLFLRLECESVPPGTLPRFELKARRVVRVQSW